LQRSERSLRESHAAHDYSQCYRQKNEVFHALHMPPPMGLMLHNDLAELLKRPGRNECTGSGDRLPYDLGFPKCR
jgi:hypothetical protein